MDLRWVFKVYSPLHAALLKHPALGTFLAAQDITPFEKMKKMCHHIHSEID